MGRAEDKQTRDAETDDDRARKLHLIFLPAWLLQRLWGWGYSSYSVRIERHIGGGVQYKYHVEVGLRNTV